MNRKRCYSIDIKVSDLKKLLYLWLHSNYGTNKRKNRCIAMSSGLVRCALLEVLEESELQVDSSRMENAKALGRNILERATSGEAEMTETVVRGRLSKLLR